MKRRDLSKISNQIISNLLLRIKDEKRLNQNHQKKYKDNVLEMNQIDLK